VNGLKCEQRVLYIKYIFSEHIATSFKLFSQESGRVISRTFQPQLSFADLPPNDSQHLLVHETLSFFYYTVERRFFVFS